jgi:TolB-like protein/DNA-binding winged helix-turn-helix (wHTH) protein/tetratricopeptide (TPR) repeat protein
MALETRSAGILRFGVFEVDVRAGELRKQGVRIKLQDQPFHVLTVLLQRPGEVVTREELRNQNWPADTFVDFDNSLNTAINKLREALGDSADNPRFIETLPRRGYRFIGSVDGVDEGVGAKGKRQGGEVRFSPRRLRWIAAIVLFAALAGMLFALNVFRVRERVIGNSRVVRIQSLAVLPLTNLSGDPNQEYFSDGMTDALITGLAQLGSIKVISRTSIMRYKKTDKSLPEIAHELNVDGIIEGTVQRSGDRVRITAQLIEGSTDRHVWANGYERDLRDVLALQDEVARAIAHEIKIKLTPQDQTRLATRQVNPEAYELYLKGRYLLNKMSGVWARQAAEYFSKAIASDGKYADAYVGLADCYVSLTNTGAAIEPSEAYGKAKDATLRALEIDNGLAEAHASLAVIRADYVWDWEGAESEFQRALELDPKDVNTHQWHAVFLSKIGRFNEATAEIAIAKELDPLSLPVATSEGETLRYARRYDEAIEELRRAIDLEPSFKFTHVALARVYENKGMFQEAAYEWSWVNVGGTYAAVRDAAGYQRAMQLRLERLQEESKREYVSPMALALSAAYAAVRDAAGYQLAVQVWLESLQEESKREYVSPMGLAAAYARLGNHEQTLAWLEEAYRQRATGLSSLKVDPFFDFLRSNPRFQDLLRRMNFPP